MHAARIAELLHPFFPEANHQRPTTSNDLYQGISTYIDILVRWNARINLTAIRNPLTTHDERPTTAPPSA
jgi:hypothetical protein